MFGFPGFKFGFPICPKICFYEPFFVLARQEYFMLFEGDQS
jgi:hypothetical protein